MDRRNGKTGTSEINEISFYSNEQVAFRSNYTVPALSSQTTTNPAPKPTLLRIKTSASSSRRPHKNRPNIPGLSSIPATFFLRNHIPDRTEATQLTRTPPWVKTNPFRRPVHFFFPFYENRHPADLIVCNFSPFHLAHSSLHPPSTIETGLLLRSIDRV